MDIREACRMLGVTEQDNERTVKLHFREKISMYHPDSVGSDSPEHLKRAQKINEAYAILRKRKRADKGSNKVAEETVEEPPLWQGEENEAAFVPRNIYMPYYMQMDQHDQYRKVARGRYVWDPNQEEFEFLLRSLNHASAEILERIERENGVYNAYDERIRLRRFDYQMKIFNSLACQYIRPISCLEKLAEPIQSDNQGRKIYMFQASIGTRGSLAVFTALSMLQSGELLYPSSLENNRILVKNAAGVSLGHVLLEDDQFYYIIIPILQDHKAQLKFVVKESMMKKKQRDYQAKVNIELYLRMNQQVDEVKRENQNLIIAETLNNYAAYLRTVSEIL